MSMTVVILKEHRKRKRQTIKTAALGAMCLGIALDRK